MQPCFFCPGLPHKLFSKLLVRIIPAYAGKGPEMAQERFVWRDHPRLRGEKYPCCIHKLYGAGSSPLTRGKVLKEVMRSEK